MRGVVRTAVLCYSWIPLQLWLQLLGVGLIVTGHYAVLGAQSNDGQPILPLLAVVLGLALICLPLLFVTGMMWRSISAPRTLVFLRYPRTKILLGVVVALLTFATLVVANLRLYNLEVPAGAAINVDLLRVWLRVFAGETAVTFGLFLLSGPYSGIAALAVGSFFALRPVTTTSTVASELGRLDSSWLTALATVVAWGAFAAWYLNTRSISPTRWSGGVARTLMAKGSARREVTVDLSKQSATTVLLLEGGSFARLMRGSLLFVAGIGALVALQPSLPLLQSLIPRPELAVLFLCLFRSMLPAIIAAQFTSRARILWLKSGYSRDQLFKYCERLGWYYFAIIIGPTLLLAAFAWIVLPHPQSSWAHLLAAITAPSVCGLYLGLMHMRSWPLLDSTLTSLLVVVGAVSALVTLFAPEVSSVITIVVGMQLMLVLVLRWLARRRWQRIDWVICKPLRLSFRVV